MHQGQLDHREDWVESAELWGQSKAVCAMADTGFNDKELKNRRDSLDDGLLVAISLPSSQTLSPGVKTGAGSH
jgi:hypothetical protein